MSPSAFFTQLSLQSPQPAPTLSTATAHAYRWICNNTEEMAQPAICAIPTYPAAATPAVAPQCTQEFHTGALNNSTTTQNAFYPYDAHTYDCCSPMTHDSPTPSLSDESHPSSPSAAHPGALNQHASPQHQPETLPPPLPLCNHHERTNCAGPLSPATTTIARV
ncbi:hypothetical protein BD779DRAFT_1682089 [Infundibulicybe gibba]|nr:hypothetical protein BD779DRAFT_1682089 [Infundibulicybe gibba]